MAELLDSLPRGDEMTQTDWLTPHEAAQYLKVQQRTILAWARAGQVKGYTLSGTKRHVWRFRRIDLDSMMVVPSVPSETED
jgi:excisionase family DNA binding protein